VHRICLCPQILYFWFTELTETVTRLLTFNVARILCTCLQHISCISKYCTKLWAMTAQSVQQLGTGWTVQGSNPTWGRISVLIQTVPGTRAVSYTIYTGSFPEVKRPGCGTDHPPPCSLEVKELE
jgi:hypothetical protein